MTEERTVSFKLFMPESLRAKLKAACALKGMTMNDVLIQLVQQWLADGEQGSNSDKGTEQ
ncbi:MAG: plasmid partition protein ParG [Cyanobacteria bacterium P01_D01_bin.36]